MERAGIDRWASPAAKIALFRSLFCGREDVYARRFVSRRTGRSGYAPACSNEWAAGICEKPRISCAECRHRKFLPVTDEVIRWHLTGIDDRGKEFAAGVYPMEIDETCRFLVVRFEGRGWQTDAGVVFDVASELEVCVAMERSRSGRRMHLWLFFAELLPATLARRLGSHLLTLAMDRRPEIGFDVYDRLVPDQDTAPKQSLGSVVAWPLEYAPRQKGNSLFVDRQFVPYNDPWAYLSTLAPLGRDAVEEIVGRGQSRGKILGVRMPAEDDTDLGVAGPSDSERRRLSGIELPPRLGLTIADQLYFEKDQLPPALHVCLLRMAAFQNLQFYEAQAMRRSTYGTPRIVASADDYPRHVAMPRGCLDAVCNLLTHLKIGVETVDLRQAGTPLDVVFRGVLRPAQQAAAQAMLAHDTGVLLATTAFGKTVVAAWLIAQRAVNTLVLVHRRQLRDQWIERLCDLLGLSKSEIGVIGGGRNNPRGTIDVATFQSLLSNGNVRACVGDYGHVIVDECHRVPAASYELLLRRITSKFVTGLTATLARRDGRHPIAQMQCGPVRYRVDPLKAARQRPFQHVVRVRPTSFVLRRETNVDGRIEYQQLCRGLAVDESRNALICRDVIEAHREGRSPLVITELRDHLAVLAARLRPHVGELAVLHGGSSGAGRQGTLSAQNGSALQRRVILATGKYIGEGFDEAVLDTLFLALPVSWQGTIIQYAGRLHRLHEGKQEVRVYDYVDLNVPMLARMFDRRAKGYAATGYEVLLPGHAVAGWPRGTPLPVDPLWKQGYSDAVRRLAADGVDISLAELFAEATRPSTADASRIGGANSATEAFFFRRLETLSETTGKFRLNARLPLPFGRGGEMEVDFLCTDPPIAIELDGPQHLGNADAYRRDRRKDLYLQEQGFLVLRFLTEDVCRNLAGVLDTVLRALCY